MSVPKVSVILAIYNVESYLREALDSLAAQTLKDIEVIGVDDGSTDGSLQILKEYAGKYPNFRYVIKPNGGIGSARNAGVAAAKGEYIGFTDPDDYVSPDMFEILYNTAVKEDSEIVVCGGTAFPDDPAPPQWLVDALSPRRIRYPAFDKALLFTENSRQFTWRMLIKRSIYTEHNIVQREDIVLGEDVGLQFKIYPFARGISLIPDKLYHYRWVRPGSIMYCDSEAKLSEKADKRILLVEHLLDTLMEYNIFKDTRKDFLQWSAEFIYGDLMKLSRKDRLRFSDRLYRLYQKADLRTEWAGYRPELRAMFEDFVTPENKVFSE